MTKRHVLTLAAFVAGFRDPLTRADATDEAIRALRDVDRRFNAGRFRALVETQVATETADRVIGRARAA
jgi:hypothetical protein